MTGPRASRSRRPSLAWEALSAMAILLSSRVVPRGSPTLYTGAKSRAVLILSNPVKVTTYVASDPVGTSPAMVGCAWWNADVGARPEVRSGALGAGRSIWRGKQHESACRSAERGRCTAGD